MPANFDAETTTLSVLPATCASEAAARGLAYNAIALTTRSVTVTDITAAAMRLVVVEFIAVSSVGGTGTEAMTALSAASRFRSLVVP